MLCHDPLRAEESARTREALIANTEAALEKIVQATARKGNSLRNTHRISYRAGNVIGRFQGLARATAFRKWLSV